MPDSFRIVGAIRGTYRGRRRVFVAGDEDAFLETGPAPGDLLRLAKNGAIAGDIPDVTAPSTLPDDFPAVEALAEAGYFTRADLEGITKAKLAKVKGIGPAKAALILKALAP